MNALRKARSTLFRQDLRYNGIIGSRSADRFEVDSDLQGLSIAPRSCGALSR